VTEPPIAAAGAVVWRSVAGRVQVLLVHRGRYDDWTFPKGKLDPDEAAVTAAVREVEEETGVAVRLGPRLSLQEYAMSQPSRAIKQVTYWCARPVDGTAARRAETYEPNAEIDGVRWVDVTDAATTLTYARDVVVLEEFGRAVRVGLHRTSPLVVLRHGHAEPRKSWRGDDRRRPLDAVGREQATRLVPMVGAFDVRVAVSSDALRCRQTVQPYVDAAPRGRPIRLDLATSLSEEGARPRRVRETARGLRVGKQRTVVCTHRPVLPALFEALGIDDRRLQPGQLLVVHRRRGQVLGSELLAP